MAKLPPKPVSAIVPVALKLKELGYDPIPLRSGKSTPPTGWPEIPNTAGDISGWRGRTVAVRMNGSHDLFAIDLDVQVPEVLEAIWARWQERWPAFMAACAIRHSSAVKVMLIGRLQTDRRHMYSGRYGVTDEHPGGNRIELFTCNDRRYIAVWGLHSEGRMYGYEGPELQEMRLDGLPEFLDADLNDLLTIANEVMEAAGLVKAEDGGEDIGEIAYDLTPDMVAELLDGRRMTLEELADEADGQFVYLHGRLFDSGSDTKNRCKAKVTSQGLTIWDWGTSTVHYWKDRGPQPEVLTPLLKKLAETAGASMFGKWILPGIQLADIYAFLPSHKYIYVPTGDLWPMASIDSVLPKVPLVRANGSPVLDAKGRPVRLLASTWLDRNRAVEQMTWAPGEPQIVLDKLASEAGWVPRRGSKTFNLYRPPLIGPGDARQAGRWLDLLRLLYPDDALHIVGYCAHRVQRPAEKINHGILLAGQPGIGKDTLLEPLRYGVGVWNFKEASPTEIMGEHNDFLRAVVLRISEARDLGEINRYALHERMKTILAAPPDMTRINIKYVPQHYVVNVMGVFITTNHTFDGIYLPADDRRHYVAATELTPEQVTGGKDDYWLALWRWYRTGGVEHVVAYLMEYDLDAAGFDAKAPPKKTEAFKRIVSAGAAPETAEMSDIIDRMGPGATDDKPDPPLVITLDALKAKALGAGGNHNLWQWLDDRKNRRAVPHRFRACGYEQVVNPDAKDGLWVIKGKRHAVYGRIDILASERMKEATKLGK